MFTENARKFAWSHSRLNDAETCPKKFFYKYIAKMKPDPEIGRQPKLLMGSAAHKIIELMIGMNMSWESAFARAVVDPKHTLEDHEKFEVEDTKERIIKFCAGIRKFKEANASRQQKFEVEASYGMNWHMLPCGYFDSDIAMRIRLDLLMVYDHQLVVIDHKFSKYTDKDHTAQITAYMAVLQAYFPDIQLIRAGLNFIPVRTDWFVHHGYQDAQAALAKRINKAADLVQFDKAHIGPHCKWCDVRFTCSREMKVPNQYVEMA